MQLKWHGTTQQTTVLQALITTCSLIPTWKCTLAHFLNFLVISNCPPNFRVYRKCLRILCDSHETSIEMHWVLFIVVLPLKWCWHESCWKAVWSYANKVSCFLPPGQVYRYSLRGSFPSQCKGRGYRSSLWCKAHQHHHPLCRNLTRIHGQHCQTQQKQTDLAQVSEH